MWRRRVRTRRAVGPPGNRDSWLVQLRHRHCVRHVRKQLPHRWNRRRRDVRDRRVADPIAERRRIRGEVQCCRRSEVGKADRRARRAVRTGDRRRRPRQQLRGGRLLRPGHLRARRSQCNHPQWDQLLEFLTIRHVRGEVRLRGRLSLGRIGHGQRWDRHEPRDRRRRHRLGRVGQHLHRRLVLAHGDVWFDRADKQQF